MKSSPPKLNSSPPFPPSTVCGQTFYPPHLFQFVGGLSPPPPSLRGWYQLWLKVNNRFFYNFICTGFNSQGLMEDVPERRNSR